MIDSRGRPGLWYRLAVKRRNTNVLRGVNLMNEFLTDLSSDSPLLWAIFVLGVVTFSALALSLVSRLAIRLGSALASPFGKGKKATNGRADGGDVVS